MLRTLVYSFMTLVGIFLASSCNYAEPDYRDRMAKLPELQKNEATATFAEGCFWHSELVFQSLVGVNEVVTGYAGGQDTLPYYEKVSEGKTGHAESVRVYYDTTQISYETLVKVFFASHDPTSLNRQGQDVGTEYRSVAFYKTQSEKEIIEKEILKLSIQNKYKNKVVTEVVPLSKFFPAEEFHQEYVKKHPDNDYVKYVSIPEFLSFKVGFEANYKPIEYIDY
jgi:peptide-methionine (S)-S-oxide reductase